MPCRYSHGYAKISWIMAECSVGLIFVKQPDSHNPLKNVFLLTSCFLLAGGERSELQSSRNFRALLGEYLAAKIRAHCS